MTIINKMKIRKVESPTQERDFISVHVLRNQSDPHWIRPLDNDIRQVFDPKQNKAFRFGEVCRWLLVDDHDELLGRIAAFVNKKYKNKGDRFPVGGIGFFDCINDQSAANRLFDTAREWLADKGMKAMDGPINFGERDKWWGLLTYGFYEPLYGMNYNPPYYQHLFETYGFQNFYNQICWSLPVASQAQLQPKFYEAHDRFASQAEFKAMAMPKKQIEKCISDFCTVYNKAWAKHEGNKEISIDQARLLFKSLKPVLDPDLVWFAYHREDPIAMYISIPDINQILRYLNGQMNLWGKLKFLYYKTRGICDRMVGVIYGIVPEFQGTGIDYFMIVEAEKFIKAKGRYKQTELLWQGDFNPKMLNISKNLGGEHSRTLVTYRYLFDPSIPFQRHPIIG
jgi:hypothetical protein